MNLTVYAVFIADSRKNWWDSITTERWRHVLILWELPNGKIFPFTQAVEYVRGRLHVEIFYVPPLEWLDSIAQDHRITEVIEFRVDKIEPFHYNLRGLMTCVSVAKSLIGVTAPLVVTPEQLAQKLLSVGGISIWEAQARPVRRGKVFGLFKLFKRVSLKFFALKSWRRSERKLPVEER